MFYLINTAGRPIRKFHGLACLLAVSMLGGCASFSKDGGFDAVKLVTHERINKSVHWVRNEADQMLIDAKVNELLKKTISVDAAVQIALLNNKGLQAMYAELGISEADMVQAGRLSNPTFSFARLARGTEIEYERNLMLPILSLLAMPTVKKIKTRHFEQMQMQTVIEVLRLADDTRRAYFSTLAAEETVNYMGQVAMAAQAGADLAQKMKESGNWSNLQQAREKSFYTEITAKLVRIKQISISERERLIRLLGLQGAQIKIKLPERLPDLPIAPRTLMNVEGLAMKNRLDVMLAERELAGLAESLGLSKTTKFINVLDLGYKLKTSGEPVQQRGIEIEFQIPLFDWGEARVEKAQTLYMQSVNRLAERVINARSEVREAYAIYQSAYDLAKHYRDTIVPLKKQISDELLLRYNGMLVDVFTLLADAREQIGSVNASMEALHAYWVADANMERALIGYSSSQMDYVAPTIGAFNSSD
jgi:Outer membrane efflux protein